MWVDVGAIKRAWLAGARSSSCAHSLMAEDEVLPRPECGQRRGHGNTDAAARCTFQGVWDELGENHPNHGTGSKPETDRQKGLKHPDKDIGWYGISGSGRLVKMLQRDAFATEVARGISTKQMAIGNVVDGDSSRDGDAELAAPPNDTPTPPPSAKECAVMTPRRSSALRAQWPTCTRSN